METLHMKIKTDEDGVKGVEIPADDDGCYTIQREKTDGVQIGKKEKTGDRELDKERHDQLCHLLAAKDGIDGGISNLKDFRLPNYGFISKDHIVAGFKRRTRFVVACVR